MTLSPFSHPQPQAQSIPQVGQMAAPENNRKRYFRELGNWCELLTGASGNAAVVLCFRAMGVAPAGFFVGVVTTHIYFLTSAASDQRRGISHLLTGIASCTGGATALVEPVSDRIQMQADLARYRTELVKLNPPQGGSYGLYFLTACGIALALGGLKIATSKKR